MDMHEDDMEKIEETTPTNIVKSRPKKEIPVPKIQFERFYKKFPTIGDMMRSVEWKTIYSNYYEFSTIEQTVDPRESDDDIEGYDGTQQAEEFAKCAASFPYFCIKYVKINHPILGLINFVPYSYQKRVIENYGKNRFNILSKFRQGGLTTVSVLWGLWRCLFKTGQRIMVVSKTDREAIAAGEIVKTAMDHLPEWLRGETEKYNEHEKQFKTTSSVMWFYTVEAARGKAITILIIDEAAFIADMHKHWKALFPVINTGGACEVISTVNGIGNWYEEVYHEAESGKNKFNIIEMDYWEHPFYNDPKWIEETRSVLGEKGWRQEVERSFMGSGSTWINGLIITALMESTRDNIPGRMALGQWKNVGSERRTEWDDGALWIWKEPIEGHEYIIGVDCAEGVGDDGDNSAFEVIDSNTLEQVAEFYSNTISPHIYAQVLNEMGYFYNTATLAIENMNQGCAVVSVLENELGYENIYSEENKGTLGIKSSKNKRDRFLQILQQRLLNGSLKINSSRFVSELNTFIFNPIRKKAEAQKGKHDDLIMALGIALFARDSELRNLPVGAELPDEMMQIYKSEIYEEIKNEIYNYDIDDLLESNDMTDMADSPYQTLVPHKQKAKFQRRLDKLLQEFGW